MKKNPSPFIQKFDELIEKREKSQIFSSNPRLNPQLKETLDEIFISLVAPSMTGKTQAVFGIKSNIPLYFVFGEEQNGYLPYSLLSNYLLELVREDMKIMKKQLVHTLAWPVVDSKLPFYFFNSRGNLNQLRTIKSKTLGLFVSLFDEAEKYSLDQNPNKDPWLLQFCNSREIGIDPITIEEFQNLNLIKRFSEKYCVFLDEFGGDGEYVFIRNLCRMLKITCIVSSTNSKVTNLIGMPATKTNSRTDGHRAWSVVFESLSRMNKESLESNSNFQFLNKELIEKASNTSKEEADRMVLFLDYFQKQLLSSRPGFALNMLEVLRYDVDFKSSFSLDLLFEDYIKKLNNSLNAKKPQAFLTFNSAKSYCKLISGNFFDEILYANNPFKKPDISYLIDEHFFFLKHPKKAKGNPFLLLRGQSRSENCPTLEVDKLFDFEIECYFDKGEELLLLACLYGKKIYSAYSVVSSGTQETPISNLSNLQAIKRSGSEQENLGYISIISSSQESLHGTGFGKFLKKLLWNLSTGLENNADIQLSMDPKISQVLDEIKVPFLLPVNMKVPKALNDIFTESPQSQIKLGTYHRTTDRKSVDSVFDLVPTAGTPSKSNKAIFEAKNRAKELNEAEYLEILQKAILYSNLPENRDISFPVHLTFCSELKEFEGTKAELHKIAVDNKINILRMKPTNHKSIFTDSAEFELVPWSEISIPAPKMTAIIFEIDDIITEFEIKNNMKYIID